jgi:hypothetical protein
MSASAPDRLDRNERISPPPRRVVFVSNDIVPGCGLPVAAPGLRVHGLATGLAARGHAVTTVMVKGPLDRQWRGPVPPPMPPDTLALGADRIGEYLRAQAPSIVVLTNANQVDQLLEHDGNRYVLDFFAPKLLELVYEGAADTAYPVAELQAHRARKLRGIERADGFIVNGRKKLPYFLAWLMQTDRDVRSVPLEEVGMCLPAAFGDHLATGPGPLRLAIAGYLQGWSVPGPWLRGLEPHLVAGECTLDAILPEHWGGASGFENPELEALLQSAGVHLHDAMTFPDYKRFLGNRDVVLDLFDRTRERELAMVTRTIVALCCGKPVVHPPFTEVSPLIEEFSAGWLVDPADEKAVARTLAEIIGDPELVTERARGARRLWAARLDPSEVVQGLERVIEQIRSVPEYVP